jgi:hypothetical protein
MILTLICLQYTAQNKVSEKYSADLTINNTGGGGVFCFKNKIAYTVQGGAASDFNKTYNLTFLFNSNLDTIQTSKKAVMGSVVGNQFYLSPFGFTNKNEVYYSGFTDNYNGISDVHFFAKSTTSNLNLNSYRGYKSKNICYPAINNRQLINDSVFVVTRSFKYATSFSQNNFSLWWLNKNLDTINQKSYINNKDCFAYNVMSIKNSNDLYAYGKSDSIDSGDAFIMRLDSVGNIKWLNSYGGIGHDQLNLVNLNGNNYLIGTYDLQSTCAASVSTIVLAKLDENGNILKINKIITDHYLVIGETKVINNFFLLKGSSCSNFGSGYSGAFLKMDTNGLINKQFIIGQALTGFTNFDPYAIAIDSLKNIYCASTSFSGSSYKDNFIKLDSNLIGCYPSEPAFNFTTTVAPLNFLHNVPMHFRVAKDSIYEVFGTINQGHGFNTIVDECVGYVGVKEEGVIQNLNFKVYPNPSTGIFFYQAMADELNDATLEVYDLTGKRIISGALSSNNANGYIDLSSVTNGIYFVKVANSQKILFNGKINVVK